MVGGLDVIISSAHSLLLYQFWLLSVYFSFSQTRVKLTMVLHGFLTGFTADWWSVGVILFELIVGIPPFNAEHPQVVIMSYVYFSGLYIHILIVFLKSSLLPSSTFSVSSSSAHPCLFFVENIC